MPNLSWGPRVVGNLPDFAQVTRTLPLGLHPFLALAPGIARSPAMARVAPSPAAARQLLEETRLQVVAGGGYARLDTQARCITLSEWYYRTGSGTDLYLDLLHELTHLRQHLEGVNLADESVPIVERPAEIEGYAVAVEEGRRLGMSETSIVRHLSRPELLRPQVERLLRNVNLFLSAAQPTRQTG